MTRFHADEYINFLKVVTPDNQSDHMQSLSRFNILEDCPVFDGLWEYCQIAAGGSLAGAARLNSGQCSTVINWAGGLHHAKRAEASGFCYINDCVLAILELLKTHARVLYVDIDIHHGDGVEEAFYTTDRVMTVSFHKFGEYFPGTGDVVDVGTDRGKNYSVNFPLKDGITDDSYREIFEPVMHKVMQVFQPGAVVLQCGADSLSGDRLGCFNLSLTGHSQCVDFFGQYDVPLLLLGGGGYTIRNVARCWAYETSRVLNADISDEMPFSDNYEFYGPEFRLHITTSNMEDHNTPEFLDKTKEKIFEQLRQLTHAPSIPFMDVPRSSPLGVHNTDYDSDGDDPDVRKKNRRARHIVEYEGSDDDADDDQYLSCLPVARKKVRKSSFPRRSASRVQRTSTTVAANSKAGSPVDPFGPASMQITPAVAMTSANGSHLPAGTSTYGGASHAALLVQTRETGTAATSDEKLERRSPFARHGAEGLNTNVDSSTGGNRTADSADRKRPRSELASRPTAPSSPGKNDGNNAEEAPKKASAEEGKADAAPDKMDISEDVQEKPPAKTETVSPRPSTSMRGASPSPENAMMEGVVPAAAPPTASEAEAKADKEVKGAPSVGSTEPLASTSKHSPSDATHDTAKRNEKDKAPATGSPKKRAASGDENVSVETERDAKSKEPKASEAPKPTVPANNVPEKPSAVDAKKKETVKGQDTIAGSTEKKESNAPADSASKSGRQRFSDAAKEGKDKKSGAEEDKAVPKSVAESKSKEGAKDAPKAKSKDPSPGPKKASTTASGTKKSADASASGKDEGADKSASSTQIRSGSGDSGKKPGAALEPISSLSTHFRSRIAKPVDAKANESEKADEKSREKSGEKSGEKVSQKGDEKSSQKAGENVDGKGDDAAKKTEGQNDPAKKKSVAAPEKDESRDGKESTRVDSEQSKRPSGV